MGVRDDEVNAEFFERLYRGYLAEHLISGELFARSFEVFRLPADFGFDLVVTNQFQTSQGRTESAASFPFSIQVKSRWLKPEDITVGPNDRPQANFTYWLKEDEVELLSKHPNSAVAFVLYMPPVDREAQTRFFIIHAHDIVHMLSYGYLRSCERGYELIGRVRDVPRVEKGQFVKELLGANHITQEGARRLTAALPDSFRLNWDAKAYFQFARSPHTADWSGLVWRTIDVCTDLSEFPNFHPLTLG